jgi:hypothetical protein
MNTVTSIRKLVRVMHAAARASLAVATIVAFVDEPQPAVRAPDTIVAAPAAAAVPAPATYERVLGNAAPMADARRPAKCGDLPRAPWNTCVALHDHEI